MPANPFLRLKSPTRFTILPGEEEELVNEGMYGKALCLYLQSSLRERGWEVPFYCCEDWGWWVEVQRKPFVLAICVYGVEDANGRIDHAIIAEPAAGRKKWSWSQFRFVETTKLANQLLEDIRAIIKADPEVELVSETEEFPDLGG